MEEFHVYKNGFPSDSFTELLFSHLKLNNVEIVDLEELDYVLSDFYYLDEYKYYFRGFQMRETKEGVTHRRELLDIETILMNAYLFGYLSQNSKQILLDKDYIEQFILPKYTKETNEIFRNIAKKYVDHTKEQPKKTISPKNFLFDLLKKHPSFTRFRKKEDSN